LFAQAAEKADQPAVAADARYQAGRLLAEKRDFERAAQVLDPFRREHQDAAQTPLALELLGRCNLELGRQAAAMEAFGQVLSKFAQHPAAKRALVGQGRVYRQQKNLDKAEECLKKALEGEPGTAGMEGQFELAGCAKDRGDLKRAAEEYLKVAILYGDEEWAARSQFEAGQCYEQLQDKAAALRTYKVVVDRYPKQQQWLERAQARLKALE
jgi:TolA-binding protein